MRPHVGFRVVLVLAAACGQPPAPTKPIVANVPAPPPVNARPASAGLLAWPVAPFSPAQIAEAKGCDVMKLAEKRYAKDLKVDALLAAFALHGTCDQATLATACATRLRDADPPAPCLDAYRAAVVANPAFAFIEILPGFYWGKVALVGAPPVASRALVGVVLDYKWGGLGTAVDWNLTIRDATTKPNIALTGSSVKATTPPEMSAALAAKVAAFAISLDSFLPVAQPIHGIDCTDNYPAWTLTLAFDDGEKLELSTYGSNLIGLGGPWQLTLGGVTYMQLAPGITRSVVELVKALSLPIGEPGGEMCSGFDLAGAAFAPRAK